MNNGNRFDADGSLVSALGADCGCRCVIRTDMTTTPTAPWTAHGADGRLVASGALSDALTRARAADGPSGGIAVPITFRDRRNGWFRAFTTRDSAGLACRQGEGWAIEWLVPAASATSEAGLRTAASALPPAILQAIDQRIEGAALDAHAERRAIDTAWAR